MIGFLERSLFGIQGSLALFIRVWSYSILSVPISLLASSLALSAVSEESVEASPELLAFIERIENLILGNGDASVAAIFLGVLAAFAILFFAAALEEVLFRGWVQQIRWLRYAGLAGASLLSFATLSDWYDSMGTGVTEPSVLAGLVTIVLIGLGLWGGLAGRPGPNLIVHHGFAFAGIMSCMLFGLVHLSNYTTLDIPAYFWPLILLSQLISGFSYLVLRLRFGLLTSSAIHAVDNFVLIVLGAIAEQWMHVGMIFFILSISIALIVAFGDILRLIQSGAEGLRGK